MRQDFKSWTKAVRSNPEDDVPYLALADDLDEKAEDTWASLIRLWVEARKISRNYEHLTLTHVSFRYGFRPKTIEVTTTKGTQAYRQLSAYKPGTKCRLSFPSGLPLLNGRDPAVVEMTCILHEKTHDHHNHQQLEATFLIQEDPEYQHKQELDGEFKKLQKSHLWTLPSFCSCRATAVWEGPLMIGLYWPGWRLDDWWEWETFHSQLLDEFPFLSLIQIAPPRWQTRYYQKDEGTILCIDRSFPNKNTGTVQTAAGDPINLTKDFPNKIIIPENLVNESLKRKWPDVQFQFGRLPVVFDDPQYAGSQYLTPSPNSEEIEYT